MNLFRRFLPRALALGLLGSSLAHAQPPTGRATFYTEPKFRGASLVVEADTAVENLEFIRDDHNKSFNDRFQSVRVEGPIHVIVFESARFTGVSTWINRDIPDLAAFSLGKGPKATWSFTISSIQVEPAAPGQEFVVWQKRDADRVVRAVYRDILSRDPDSEGVRFYVNRLMDAGWSEDELRSALRRSDEFNSRDLSAIVKRTYRSALGRDPDSSGIASYSKALSRGQTEAELFTELRNSREGQDYWIGQVITKAYRDVLHRDPDAAGMENYRRMVRDKAYDENKIRDSLRKSDEYRNLKK